MKESVFVSLSICINEEDIQTCSFTKVSEQSLLVVSQLSEDYGHHYKLVICDIFDFAELPLNIVFFGASA